MVFNTTFNDISVISWRSVLSVEETGVPGENHRPVASLTNVIRSDEQVNQVICMVTVFKNACNYLLAKPIDDTPRFPYQLMFVSFNRSKHDGCH